jgi:hypothetical protein
MRTGDEKVGWERFVMPSSGFDSDGTRIRGRAVPGFVVTLGRQCKHARGALG